MSSSVVSIIQDNFDNYKTMDNLLCEKINAIYDINSVSYYFFNRLEIDLLPKTKRKINEIIVNDIKNGSAPYGVDKKWFDDNTCNIIAEKYLSGEFYDLYGVLSKVSDENKYKIFNKLLDKYSKTRSYYLVSLIKTAFSTIGTDYLLECCELLYKSSPAVASCLLSRNDISEKYTIKGLKAVSKLSSQRKIDAKIDIQILKNLGPRARLDAMNQLLGLCDSCYRNIDDIEIPFSKVPEKSELEEFLFPCSLKYNEEVARIVNQYERLINKTKKEVSNGKCV